MMNQMKELSVSSMENANGGAVVKYCGMYVVASDPGSKDTCYLTQRFMTAEAAQKKAEEKGKWSSKVYTRQEYQDAIGRPIYW